MIGILATVLIVLINPKFQIQRANDGKRKTDLKQIQAGLEIYRADVGGYPIDSAADGSANAVQNSGTSLVNPTSAITIYIQNVPKDPKTVINYYYCTQLSCGAIADCPATTPQNPCTSYALFSCLENSNDSDGLASGSVPAAVVTGLACPSGTTKYFKVINP